MTHGRRHAMHVCFVPSWPPETERSPSASDGCVSSARSHNPKRHEPSAQACEHSSFGRPGSQSRRPPTSGAPRGTTRPRRSGSSTATTRMRRRHGSPSWRPRWRISRPASPRLRRRFCSSVRYKPTRHLHKMEKAATASFLQLLFAAPPKTLPPEHHVVGVLARRRGRVLAHIALKELADRARSAADPLIDRRASLLPPKGATRRSFEHYHFGGIRRHSRSPVHELTTTLTSQETGAMSHRGKGRAVRFRRTGPRGPVFLVAELINETVPSPVTRIRG
jgi:hypothetical protein